MANRVVRQVKKVVRKPRPKKVVPKVQLLIIGGCAVYTNFKYEAVDKQTKQAVARLKDAHPAVKVVIVGQDMSAMYYPPTERAMREGTLPPSAEEVIEQWEEVASDFGADDFFLSMAKVDKHTGEVMSPYDMPFESPHAKASLDWMPPNAGMLECVLDRHDLKPNQAMFVYRTAAEREMADNAGVRVMPMAQFVDKYRDPDTININELTQALRNLRR